MAKTIVIKIKKAGNGVHSFSISDNLGNVLGENISKESLISGVAFSVDDLATVVIATTNTANCCNKSWTIPITAITETELAAIVFEPKNTANLWKHLTDTTLYNSFYGCTHSYIIEYPFAYQYYDEIVQNIKDYTKSYKYLPSILGVFDSNRKIQNNEYFTTALVYNDQQCSGTLELVAKPSRNLNAYLSYPKYNTDSKSIIYTKADNFYQFNTFWDIVVDKEVPIFTQSCTSLSIDKIVNQDNMNYGKKTYHKAKIRAKDLKVRLALTDKTDTHLVSQVIFSPSQISYR